MGNSSGSKTPLLVACCALAILGGAAALLRITDDPAGPSGSDDNVVAGPDATSAPPERPASRADGAESAALTDRGPTSTRSSSGSESSVEAAVFGTVTDAAGAPVADAVIRVDWELELDLPWQGDQLRHLGTTRSGDDGRYRVAIPAELTVGPLGRGHLWVHFDPPWAGRAETLEGWFATGVDERRFARVDGTVRRDPAVRAVEVTVCTPSGARVANAEVNFRTLRYWIHETTRGDGTTRLELPAGDPVEQVQAWHPAHGRSPLTKDPGETALLVLRDTREVLSGRVVFEDGRPAAGVELSWSQVDGDAEAEARAEAETDIDPIREMELTTGPGGWFQARGIQAGKWMQYQELLEPLSIEERLGLLPNPSAQPERTTPPSPSEQTFEVPGASITLIARYSRVLVRDAYGEPLPPDTWLRLKRWTPWAARQLALWPAAPTTPREPTDEEDRLSEIDTQADGINHRHELWLRPGSTVRYELHRAGREQPLAAGWLTAPAGPSTERTLRLDPF